MNARILTFATATALLLGSAAALAATQSTESPNMPTQSQGAQQYPGQTPSTTTNTGPGASQYAPGQQMQRYGSRSGAPGASGYAPGQQMQSGTTTPNSTMNQGTGNSTISR